MTESEKTCNLQPAQDSKTENCIFLSVKTKKGKKWPNPQNKNPNAFLYQANYQGWSQLELPYKANQLNTLGQKSTPYEMVSHHTKASLNTIIQMFIITKVTLSLQMYQSKGLQCLQSLSLSLLVIPQTFRKFLYLAFSQHHFVQLALLAQLFYPETHEVDLWHVQQYLNEG